VPFAVFYPPDAAGLAGALGLSLLMAATFWVTTEATRRGPVGLVSPLTALSPALTVMLALILLAERPSGLALAGVLVAVVAAALLVFRPSAPGALGGWLGVAVASLVMQGIGAFIAKIVVTGHGPTDLLLTSASVQLAVGAVLARREPADVRRLVRGRGLVIVCALVSAAIATIGYLYALSVGPASVIVPLVATSPSLAGLLGIVVLREPSTRRQIVAIALGTAAAVVLGTS
jgi:drug/metabolite transporter (DMT)-like permease